MSVRILCLFFFFQAEDGIRDDLVTGVQTCALPICSDPILRGIEDIDNDRQANRIIVRVTEAVRGEMDSKVERDLRITIYGWLAFTFEMCRQRLMDPSIDAGRVADACSHALLDAIGRVPRIPSALNEAGGPDQR